MRKSDVIKYFKTSTAVWTALGITSGAVSQWHELIPEKQAMKLERLTKGELKYDESLYQKDTSDTAA
ncbi:Cro/CI family transcriptional regulator [Marinomonas fungiae]|uniref:Cro/CI family transcriptional regulator n=1 Tax=Marinomonas fungiae TaxID=1137284 RepID=UPI003A93F828